MTVLFFVAGLALLVIGAELLVRGAAYLILSATEHDALPAFSQVMLVFVLPLTAVTLLVLMVRAVRGRAPRGA